MIGAYWLCIIIHNPFVNYIFKSVVVEKKYKNLLVTCQLLHQ